MDGSPPIEKSRSPFSSLIGRFGIGPQKDGEVIAKQKQSAEEERVRKEVENSFKEIEIKAQNIRSELLARKREGLPSKKLTDNGNGTFGLFDAESDRILAVSAMNTQTDRTAYFQYKKMEEHAIFEFGTDNRLKEVRFYDVKAMQRNNAPESEHLEYRTTYKMDAKDTAEAQKLVSELSPKLLPLFDSFSKPETKPLG